MRKLILPFNCIAGFIVNLVHKIRLVRVPYGLNSSVRRDRRIIISLTSYGRRVKSVVPCAIASLMRQTEKPDMIILWLDRNKWNNDNLPSEIRRLMKKGLNVNFCKDLKSYKKLVTAAECFPDDIIITCDDDMYYDKNMVKSLMSAYAAHPNSVCTQMARIIQFDKSDLLPYNKWKLDIYDTEGNSVFPLGGSGCLYGPGMLHADVGNMELAMKMAPMADDVWFYFMALMNGAGHYVLPNRRCALIHLDAFYQKSHKRSNLMSLNVNQGMNDRQIKAVMDYYHITPNMMR